VKARQSVLLTGGNCDAASGFSLPISAGLFPARVASFAPHSAAMRRYLGLAGKKNPSRLFGKQNHHWHQIFFWIGIIWCILKIKQGS
jgi:hypothetical protein